MTSRSIKVIYKNYIRRQCNAIFIKVSLFMSIIHVAITQSLPTIRLKCEFSLPLTAS